MSHTDDQISQYHADAKTLLERQKTILTNLAVREGEILEELATIKKFTRSLK